VLVLPGDGTIGEIPSITPNLDFYVQRCCGTPDVDPDAWEMVLRDRGTEVAVIDRVYLQSLATRDLEHTLECIGTTVSWQQIGNAAWVTATAPSSSSTGTRISSSSTASRCAPCSVPTCIR
jgi:hypothetical protein